MSTVLWNERNVVCVVEEAQQSVSPPVASSLLRESHPQSLALMLGHRGQGEGRGVCVCATPQLKRGMEGALLHIFSLSNAGDESVSVYGVVIVA